MWHSLGRPSRSDFVQLAATMEEVSDNASVINNNTGDVREEVNVIADKTSKINTYSKEMNGRIIVIKCCGCNGFLFEKKEISYVLS